MRHGRRALFTVLTVSLCTAAVIAAENDIPGWGRFLNPAQDCEYSLDQDTGNLTIMVPGGAHDLSSEQGEMTAPRVLREVVGDFTVQVKVSGAFDPRGAVVPTRPPYHGAGLVLGSDARNYVRLERATFIQFNTNKRLDYGNFEIRRNGQVERIGDANDCPLPREGDVYFKLERRGQRIFGSVSPDGQEWQALGSKTLTTAPRKLFVGVAAINASRSPFNPEFSELKLTTATPEGD